MTSTKPKKYVNPFYLLLVLAGVAFCVTACAYGVMTVRALRPDVAGDLDAVHPLVRFIDTHGFRTMAIEIAVLGVCTVAAIGTDEFWARRAR